jgi:hypothetical protein
MLTLYAAASGYYGGVEAGELWMPQGAEPLLNGCRGTELLF